MKTFSEKVESFSDPELDRINGRIKYLRDQLSRSNTDRRKEYIKITLQELKVDKLKRQLEIEINKLNGMRGPNI